MERHVELQEKEIDRLNKRLVELDSQNFALSKGVLMMDNKDAEVCSYLE